MRCPGGSVTRERKRTFVFRRSTLGNVSKVTEGKGKSFLLRVLFGFYLQTGTAGRPICFRNGCQPCFKVNRRSLQPQPRNRVFAHLVLESKLAKMNREASFALRNKRNTDSRRIERMLQRDEKTFLPNLCRRNDAQRFICVARSNFFYSDPRVIQWYNYFPNLKFFSLIKTEECKGGNSRWLPEKRMFPDSTANKYSKFI